MNEGRRRFEDKWDIAEATGKVDDCCGSACGSED